MKGMAIPRKTWQECETEIENIMSGKNKSRNTWIIRRFISARKLAGDSEETIKEMLTIEYHKKYGELSSGKTSLEQMKKNSLKDLKSAKDFK